MNTPKKRVLVVEAGVYQVPITCKHSQMGLIAASIDEDCSGFHWLAPFGLFADHTRSLIHFTCKTRLLLLAQVTSNFP